MDSESANVERRAKLVGYYLLAMIAFVAMAGASLLLDVPAWTKALLAGAAVMGMGMAFNAVIIMETSD